MVLTVLFFLLRRINRLEMELKNKIKQQKEEHIDKNTLDIAEFKVFMESQVRHHEAIVDLKQKLLKNLLQEKDLLDMVNGMADMNNQSLEILFNLGNKLGYDIEDLKDDS